MDVDNGEGTDYGSGGQAWWRGAMGEKWDNCNSVINKIFKILKNKYKSTFYFKDEVL